MIHSHPGRFILLSFSLIILSGSNCFLNAQTFTGGEMTFTVRTVTDGGKYSPKHVLAIWVEDSNGFVKTRKLRANNRKQYLYTWKSASGGNVVDAITGATLSNHTTHTIKWDCKDINGDIAPDGNYKVFVEFTDKHAQGPLYSITFTKGTSSVSMSPADASYFKDIDLVFEPEEVIVNAGFTCSAADLTVTFSNSSTGADTYQWDFGDGNSSDAENPEHTYEEGGTYTVSLTAINGSITDSCQEEISVAGTVGIRAFMEGSLVYPNPGNGIIKIDLNRIDQICALRIHSLEGRLLLSKKVEPGTEMEINISNFSDGIYIIELEGIKRSIYQVFKKE